MNEMLHSLSFVSAGAASALFSAIWEGAVLALGVYLCLRLLPGLSAAARSVVWLNVFILLVLLHFVPAFAGRAPDLTGGHVPSLHLDPRWSLGVVALWAALSLWRAVQLVLGIAHLRRLARRAVPVEVDAELQALLAEATAGRAPSCASPMRSSGPAYWDSLRPRVLVPPALIEHLTPQELQQVVLHEMEHLRRGDDWTNLLQKIGLVLFPLNPVLLWVERRLCAERELACDDRVMQSSAGRKAYALCLTRLAEFSMFRRGFSLVLGLWERRPELVRRIQRIVSQPVRSMGRSPAMAATGSLLAGALGCAVALSHSPQLVSFVPARSADFQARSLDPHEVARALGGTPHLMKAAMPAQTECLGATGRTRDGRAATGAQGGPESCSSQTARRQPDCHASIRGRAPLPILDQRAVIVLTEVTDVPGASARGPGRFARWASGPATARPVIRATYAIVPTPNGWLIIQI